MKKCLFLVIYLQLQGSAYSQGVTLWYIGSGGWYDPMSWIQINTPDGQTPIQRVPTELDNVVISGSQMGGLPSNVGFDTLEVGGSISTGARCKSLHLSHFDSQNEPVINVYTDNGGSVLIDSGSNFAKGHFQLYGGNPAITDLEIINSTFGSLFSHADWSSIILGPNGKVRLKNITYGGHYFGSQSQSTTGNGIYAENCTFEINSFILGDNSTDTIFNSTFQDNINNPSLGFHIGRNANFVSNNVSINSYCCVDFFSSGSVFTGSINLLIPGGLNFNQEDITNPLPNIINGDVYLREIVSIGIIGDLKISGNIHCVSVEPHPPPVGTVVINGENIFEIGGVLNYGDTSTTVTRCEQNYCHFNLEFFGSNNSNIDWPIGFPVDTLVINKSGCAKVTVTNSLYVSGAAKILQGQLVLKANDTIPYKFVCAGDLDIMEGGGIFLSQNEYGVANIAVEGHFVDHNSIADTACTGFSNPYNGNIALYSNNENAGNRIISLANTANIGNLQLIGKPGSGFMLGSNVTVNHFNFINVSDLLLGNYNLVITGDIEMVPQLQ